MSKKIDVEQILDDVKDAFNDNDGETAIKLLQKAELKMRTDDIETANFTQMSVSSRRDFWKTCCVERDEIIKNTTPEQIEKFKKECEALRVKANEYFNAIDPHLESFKETVTGGKIFIGEINKSPLRPLPRLSYFLKENDFGELLDAYYHCFICLREFAFLMFLMFDYFQNEIPSSEGNLLMKKLNEIGVLDLQPSSLFPNKLTDYDCDLLFREINEDTASDFSVLKTFLYLLNEFETSLGKTKRARVQSDDEESDEEDEDDE